MNVFGGMLGSMVFGSILAAMMSMPKLTLKNWSITSTAESSYSAPELYKLRIQGEVYNHPEFKDGTFIITSSIVFVDAEAKTITTASGSVYHLNKKDVDERYEDGFSDAFNRVFKKEN